MREEHFKQDAKQIVDVLFDKGFFVEKITRDDMQAIEDLLSFLLSSRFESYKKAESIIKSLNKNI